jgi:hypothetical protein
MFHTFFGFYYSIYLSLWGSLPRGKPNPPTTERPGPLRRDLKPVSLRTHQMGSTYEDRGSRAVTFFYTFSSARGLLSWETNKRLKTFHAWVSDRRCGINVSFTLHLSCLWVLKKDWCDKHGLVPEKLKHFLSSKSLRFVHSGSCLARHLKGQEVEFDFVVMTVSAVNYHFSHTDRGFNSLFVSLWT